MRPLRFRPFLGVLVIALTLACAPTLPLTAPLPTQGPGSVETIIAATANAAASQTAVFLPSATPTASETPTPSRTPTETPTPTVTVIFRLPTFTFTPEPTSIIEFSSGEDYDCDLTSQSPANGTIMSPNLDFDAKWTVKNTGDKAWDRNSVDYIYVSGDKMHKQKAYDLSITVATGDGVTLTVDMVAPGAAGTYTTKWGLRKGSVFCTFSLTIEVR
jgi:hypothetical protein